MKLLLNALVWRVHFISRCKYGIVKTDAESREKNDVWGVNWIPFTEQTLRFAAGQKCYGTSLLVWKERAVKDQTIALGNVGMWITISEEWPPDLLICDINHSVALLHTWLQNRDTKCFCPEESLMLLRYRVKILAEHIIAAKKKTTNYCK